MSDDRIHLGIMPCSVWVFILWFSVCCYGGRLQFPQLLCFPPVPRALLPVGPRLLQRFTDDVGTDVCLSVTVPRVSDAVHTKRSGVAVTVLTSESWPSIVCHLLCWKVAAALLLKAVYRVKVCLFTDFTWSIYYFCPFSCEEGAEEAP